MKPGSHHYITILFFIIILSCPIWSQPFDYFPDNPPSPYGFIEGGYGSRLSVYQGDSLTFFISTHASKFDLKIYRYGKEKTLIATLPNLTGGLKEVKETDSVYAKGCNWKPTATIQIPENWKAGAYLGEFPVDADSVNPVLFFVKEKNPANRTKIVVACAINTYCAYNMFGGKSNYPEFSSGGNDGLNYSVKLSYLRPFNRNNHHGINRGSFYSYDGKLIRWLEQCGYEVDVIGDNDLDSDPLYFANAKVVLVCGHQEYWTTAMRKNVENYVSGGGNFMALSGNTCWWQIRYENNNQTYVCYKHMQDLEHLDDEYTTKEWHQVMNGTVRENKFLGTSYEKGQQAGYRGWLDSKDGFGGFILHNTQHWAFKNTGLKDGDTLGFRGDSSIVGYEVDHANFRFKDGLIIPNGDDQCPLNFRILGLAPSVYNIRGWAMDEPSPGYGCTMGIYKSTAPNGGFLFNAATIRWVWGLNTIDSKVSRFTKNMIDHFLENKYPPEFTFWYPKRTINVRPLKTPMQFPTRDITVQYGKSQNFRVEAVDYDKSTVSIAWKINNSDTTVGRVNNFKFNSMKYKSGTNTVTAYAYNSTDTVTMSWNVNVVPGTGVAITSEPDTVFSPGKAYSYVLSSYTMYNNAISYRPIYLPKWAIFDEAKNVIQGIPPAGSAAVDSISILAVDLADPVNRADIQTVVLHLTETTYVKGESLPDKFMLYQNYPNPFNGSTKIRFFVKHLSDIKIIIADILGRRIRSFQLGELPEGMHEIAWDGNNETGQSVSSGIYFYNVHFNDSNAQNVTLSKKMTHLK
ncbi:MAG: N,N-dimethylformamidase beta subunit family domain-containing protein [Methanococcaceae archaeon]